MSRSELPPPLSEAQLEIMNIVWDRGEVTVGHVWRTLSAQRQLARNTVLTLMMRMEEKGWLRHRTEGNAYYYSAVVPKKATLRDMARRLVDTAFGGSTEGLVHALLEDHDLSPQEAARIRKLLRDSQATKPKGKKS